MGSKAPLPDKNADFSKWYDQVSEKAELADVRYGVKGFVVYRPNLMFIIEQVYESLETLTKRRTQEDTVSPSNTVQEPPG